MKSSISTIFNLAKGSFAHNFIGNEYIIFKVFCHHTTIRKLRIILTVDFYCKSSFSFLIHWRNGCVKTTLLLLSYCCTELKMCTCPKARNPLFIRKTNFKDVSIMSNLILFTHQQLKSSFFIFLDIIYKTWWVFMIIIFFRIYVFLRWIDFIFFTFTPVFRMAPFVDFLILFFLFFFVDFTAWIIPHLIS